MPDSNSQTQGFTLLELMVALTIFLFIGLGAHTMLHSLLKAREAEKQHSLHLSQLQKAVWVISQDMSQMDSASFTAPAGNYAASFMRIGWDNPLGSPRSDMLLVSYSMEGGNLKRYYWPAEQADSSPQTQLMLEGVSDFSVRRLSSRSVEVLLNTTEAGTVRKVMR